MYKQNLAFVYLVLINYIKALTKQELNVQCRIRKKRHLAFGTMLIIWWYDDESRRLNI